MNLLRYAYRLRHLDLYDEVRYPTSAASFEDLLIHQLAAEASELLARGLHRDYLRTESMLTNPRGRIDFGGYLQAASRAGVALPCVHHPRSEDTCINRALHGGLEMAAGMTLDHELSGHVRRLAKSFAASITPKKTGCRRFRRGMAFAGPPHQGLPARADLDKDAAEYPGRSLGREYVKHCRRRVPVRHESFFSGAAFPFTWREPCRVRGSG